MSSSITTEFGLVLRRLRQEAGLTQEALGLAADLQRNYISELELGGKQPSLNSVFKLAVALNLKPSKLISLVEIELNKP